VIAIVHRACVSTLIDGSEKRNHDWTSVRVSHDFRASQKGWKTWALRDDTTYVLENLLGYMRARIEELKARSVLQ
jgi:hypothetical protein